MYNSPIHLAYTTSKIEEVVKDRIFKICERCDIDVNEEDLLAALRADRKRYEEAYDWGYREGYKRGREVEAQKEEE